MSKVFQSPSKIKVGSNQDKDIVILKASLGCSAVTWMWPDISSTKVCLSIWLTADFILISFLLFISILPKLFCQTWILQPVRERKPIYISDCSLQTCFTTSDQQTKQTYCWPWTEFHTCCSAKCCFILGKWFPSMDWGIACVGDLSTISVCLVDREGSLACLMH